MAEIETLQFKVQRMEGFGATASCCREQMGLFQCTHLPVHPAYLGCRFGSELAELHPPGKGYTFSWVWSLFLEGADAKLCQAEAWLSPFPVLLNGTNQYAVVLKSEKSGTGEKSGQDFFFFFLRSNTSQNQAAELGR